MNYPTVDLRKLSNIYIEYARSKINMNIFKKEYTLTYLLIPEKENKKIIIDTIFKPKDDIQAIAFLYLQIKNKLNDLLIKHNQFKILKYTNTHDFTEYTLIDCFTEQELQNICTDINNHIYNIKADLNYTLILEMLKLYTSITNLNLYFNTVDSISKNKYEYTDNWLKTFIYNPFWFNKDDEFNKIINKNYEIEDVIDESEKIKKFEDAKEIELI